MADRRVLRVTLRYTDINSLFNKPDVSPFSEEYNDYSTTSGIDVGVSEGARLGVEFDHAVDRSRLLSASSRPPAGLWERRFDCVAA